MNEFSKVLPKIELYPCRELAHPQTDSCLLSSANVLINSCVGSAGFYAILYLCQFASMVMKKKKKTPLKDYLRLYFRSTVFGTLVSAGTFILHCVFRRLFGKYYHYSVIFGPACISGCSIFLESRKGQELCTNAFANCVLELWLRRLQHSKVLKWNPNIQTILFMVLSSLVSSLLSSTNFDSNYFWFFIPPKVNQSDKLSRNCFHREKCWRHIFNLFLMYSLTGLALQHLKAFAKNIKNPKLFLSTLARPKAFKLAAFLGGYVTLYQAIRCCLYQKYKKYSAFHDSFAGFLAGAAFRFQPTIPIFNSAIITIVQILAEAGCRRKILPNIPYLEISFVLFCGILFHSRVLLSEHCPQLLIYITSAVTHGMSDAVTHNYKSIIKDLMTTTHS